VVGWDDADPSKPLVTRALAREMTEVAIFTNVSDLRAWLPKANSPPKEWASHNAVRWVALSLYSIGTWRGPVPQASKCTHHLHACGKRDAHVVAVYEPYAHVVADHEHLRHVVAAQTYICTWW
jgi:hypothetical protein